MANDRTVHKTVRITQEIYDYIENLSDGTTWNDKVNNAFEELIHGLENRQRSLELVNEQIKQSQEKLNNLYNLFSEARKIMY